MNSKVTGEGGEDDEEVQKKIIDIFNFKPKLEPKLWRIYKAKIKIFSILDIYTHNFKSSGALQNKYYSTQKWLESGLLYQDSIEHNIGGYLESPNWSSMKRRAS